MSRRLRDAAWAGWLSLAAVAGRHYVAGPTVEGAIETCRRTARQGFAGAICYWNHESETPPAVGRRYLEALAALEGADLDCYLSLKATAVDYERELLREIGARAAAAGVRIHLDSMWPESAAPTWSLLTDVAAGPAAWGCTLPGRWQRSVEDAERAIELGLTVRVVKGQWADPGRPALDARAGCLAVIDRLAGRARRVAVATHDPHLALAALQRLRSAGTACELELLLGLPRWAVVPLARAEHVPVRIYVPYGAAWVPYCLSQARQNPRLLWWALRDAALAASGDLTRSLVGGRARSSR